jgi:TPR repeat protein
MRLLATEKLVPAFSHIVTALALAAIPNIALADASADYTEAVAAHRRGDIVGAMTPLKSAADAGHAAAQALYGSILDAAELDDDATQYLKKSAAQKDPDGMFSLAKMYLTGEAPSDDPAEAGRLIRAAAEAGHERATILLANAYINRDEKVAAESRTNPEAARYLIKAAEYGDVSAIEALSLAYQPGGDFGIAPDAQKAKFWSDRLNELRGTGAKGSKK